MFSAVTLSTDYADNRKTVGTGGMTQGVLYVLYTTGAGGTANNVDIKLEFSPDGDSFFQETSSSTTSGVSTIYQHSYTFEGAVAATAYSIRIPFDIADKNVRVSLKETVAAGSAGTVTAYLELSGK